MKKDLFVVSDIHGHFLEMYWALLEAGFDENNEKHMLIVCGDIFDRGVQNVEVYEFLKKLTEINRAIVLNGNHHKFLIDWLEGKDISPFNYVYNGLDTTLSDFLNRTMPFENWCRIDKNIKEPTYNDFANFSEYARKEIMKEYPQLLDWLKSRPRYYETKNYIFTHGALDLDSGDWRKPHCCKGKLTDWDALDFDDGGFFARLNTTGKTIVLGHFGANYLRDFYKVDTKDINDYSILKTDDKKIYIDSTVVLSKKINVLKIENEETLMEIRG